LPLGIIAERLYFFSNTAEGHDVAMAIERRRVQARGAAAVQKQGIGAIQPITE